MTDQEKENIDREVYESAYKRMQKHGLSSILSSPRLVSKRDVISSRIISYYESTEEYEKCVFLKDFFDRIEKDIALKGIIDGLKDNPNKEVDKN